MLSKAKLAVTAAGLLGLAGGGVGVALATASPAAAHTVHISRIRSLAPAVNAPAVHTATAAAPAAAAATPAAAPAAAPAAPAAAPAAATPTPSATAQETPDASEAPGAPETDAPGGHTDMGANADHQFSGNE